MADGYGALRRMLHLPAGGARSAFAASTGSPAMNATAVGPSSIDSSSSIDASTAARRINVFLTTANRVPPSASDRLSSVMSDTVSPR